MSARSRCQGGVTEPFRLPLSPVRYSPQTAILSILDNAPANPQKVTLTATVIAFEFNHMCAHNLVLGLATGPVQLVEIGSAREVQRVAKSRLLFRKLETDVSP